MKHLKVTSVVLSIAICMSMFMPTVSVLADEAAAPSETQSTEETEKQTPKETEKPAPKTTEKKETEPSEKKEAEATEEPAARETEKQEPVETEKQAAAETTEKQEPSETAEDQKPSETKESTPAETEDQKPAETEKQPEETESQEPSETEDEAPEATEAPIQETEVKKAAKNAKGSCGDNMEWELDSNGTLTISGSGVMDALPGWSSYSSSIKKVVIGNGVTKIANSAFYGCTNLTSVSLPDSLEDIGSAAFYDCKGLTTVVIPANVYEISQSAFEGCSNLSKVTLQCNLWKIGAAVFRNCSSLTTINIPEQLETVGYNAFEGCTSLSAIVLPDTVKSIRDSAFKDCKNLKQITIPSSVSDITNDAFNGCTSLKTVTIPETVTRIYHRAFQGCTGLTEIHLTQSLKIVWSSAFAGCSSLGDVYYNGSETEWNNIKVYSDNAPLLNATLHTSGSSSFNGDSGNFGNGFSWSLSKDGILTITGSGNMADFDSEKIGDYYFYKAPWNDYKNKINKVVFSGNITSIGNGAFNGCINLKTLTLPNSITSIGRETISNSGITSLSIPSGVTKIVDNAFINCTSLETVSISSGVQTIGENAFRSCTNLSKVTMAEGLTVIGDCAFRDCSKLTGVSIPDSVTTLGSYSFSGAGLKEITIPGKIKTISEGSFSSCSNLTGLIIKSGVTVIGVESFLSCTKLSSVTIPSTVTKISNNAFKDCKSISTVFYDGSSGNWEKLISNSSGNNYLKNANVTFGSSGPTKYTVTLGTCENGSATFSPSSAAAGETVTVIPEPDPGYEFRDFVIDGVSKSGKTFEMPSKDVVVDVRFTQLEYTVNISCSKGGKATWLSQTSGTAGAGDRIKLKITMEEGYELGFITVNGKVVDNPFTMPADNADVYVTFVKSNSGYPISLAVEGEGEAKLSAVQANPGDVITVTAKPSNGYELDAIKVNGVALASGVTEFKMGSAATLVEVSFKKKLYSINVSVPNGGGTASAYPATAGINDKVTVNYTPNTGYELDKIIVNKTDITKEKTFTMTAAEADVVVSFKKSVYKVTCTCGPNGTASVDKTTANYGDTITVTANPAAGYVVDTIKVNKVALKSGVTKFTMSNIDTTVEVSFKTTPLPIEVSVETDGGTASVAPTEACVGETVNVKCETQTGYELDKIVVYGYELDGTSFIMEAGGTTVHVYFKKIDYEVTCTSGSNGIASVNKKTANYGDTVTVSATPATGFIVDKIIVNDVALPSGTTTFKMDAKNTTVQVTFKREQYKITVSVPDGGGTATPSVDKADAGDLITLDCDPATGYELDTVKVNGTAITTGTSFTMPAKDTTVVVSFKKSVYKVNVNTPVGGTVKLNKTSANYGDEITVTATPSTSTGYELDSIKVDGETLTGNTFKMPANTVSVVVTFKKTDFKVNVNCGSNGTASVDKKTANYGDTVTITATPATGYVVDTIKVNTVAITGTTFKMPAKETTVDVAFKKVVYTLSINTPTGGTAKLSKTTANYKDEISVTTTTETGYKLDYITVNDVKITGDTFEMPAKNAAVVVAFKKIDYQVKVTYGNNGTAIVDKNPANYKDTVIITASPDKGYTVDTITVNNKTLDPGVLEFVMGTEPANVHVTFKHAQYSIKLSFPDGNGSASAVSMANEGDEITISPKPDTGYELDYIEVDGNKITGRSFTMGAGSVEVKVYFKKSVYALSVNKPAGGTSSLSAAKASYCEKITVTAKASAGYELDSITVNDEKISGNTFEMPDKNVSVVVTYKKVEYKITVKKTDNGTTTVDKNTAYYGDKITITATADEGYKVDAIMVGGAAQSANTFTVTGNVTVEVSYAKIKYTVSVKPSAGGKASANMTTAGFGDEILINIEPNTGYEVDSIMLDGAPSEQAFLMPSKNVVVNVIFKKIDYEIAVAPDHGKAGVNKNPANVDDTITVTTTPDDGYELDHISVYGNPITGNTFKMQAKWTPVEVYFRLKDLKVKVTPLSGGSAKADKTTAKMGETVELTVTPDPGFELEYIMIGETKLTKNTFVMGSADTEVYVAFKKIKYAVSFSYGAYGKAGINTKSAVVGDQIIVDTYPDEGYYPVIKVDGQEISSNTFPMPANSIKVEVTFEKFKPLDVGETAKLGNADFTVTAAASDSVIGSVRLDKITDDGKTAVAIRDEVVIKGYKYRITSVANYAISNNQSMTSLTIGNYVTSMGNYAVSGCRNLVKVSGGLRLKTIGTKAFAGCPKLKSFSISSAVLAKISAYTFYGDKSLKTIYINKTTKLTKKGVKKSLKGSKIKTVKVKKAKVKKYKKFFSKKNCGRKVKVKK